MNKITHIGALAVAAVLSLNLCAAEPANDRNMTSPIGVAVLPFRFCEWPSPTDDVLGFRLGLIGRHNNVTGFDIGFVNYADRALYGAAAGAINSHGDVDGMQAGLVNATGDGHGIQLGLWNVAEDFAGLQLGLLNYAHRMCGVQIGLGNIILESPFSTCVFLNMCF